MATAVQDLPGDGASKVAVKAFAAMALSSLVSRWRSSLHDGGNESFVGELALGEHIRGSDDHDIIAID